MRSGVIPCEEVFVIHRSSEYSTIQLDRRIKPYSAFSDIRYLYRGMLNDVSVKEDKSRKWQLGMLSHVAGKGNDV